MPELPEVEVLRRYLHEAAVSKKIERVSFHDHLDKIFQSPREDLRQALEGQHITETTRRGKYLFTRLNSGQWLHWHFGMSGSFQLFRGEELPPYARFVLHLAIGDKLAFRDMRKFGVIQLIDDPDHFSQRHRLGPDLLDVEPGTFVNALEGRRLTIKAALLEQKHFAGIGNWIADEMLFNCGIHPATFCRELSSKDFKMLLKDAQQIVREAIEADTHFGGFPEHFFVNFRKEGALHPRYPDSPVKRLVVGGRGTFIVPGRQVLIE